MSTGARAMPGTTNPDIIFYHNHNHMKFRLTIISLLWHFCLCDLRNSNWSQKWLQCHVVLVLLLTCGDYCMEVRKALSLGEFPCLCCCDELLASWALRVELRRRWLLGVEPDRPLLLGVELLSLGVDSAASVGPPSTAFTAVNGTLDFIPLASELSMKECLFFEDGLPRPPATNDPLQALQYTTWGREYRQA